MTERNYELEHASEDIKRKNMQPKRERLIKELATHVKNQMSHAAYHPNPHEHIARWLLADVIPLKDEHVAEGVIDAQTRIQAAYAERDRISRQYDELAKERDYYRDRFNRILEDVRNADQEYVTWRSPTQPS